MVTALPRLSSKEADKRILQALLEEEDENQRVHQARREQALADVFLPGESRGWWSLAGCRL